ncbi:hypothetical protein ABZV60_35795 [Streptomyces sp. NPDC004787]|uniref:hypothetical protein n=1 Tax=Streptomyces sp. NPDC004787 TaxID=3154291 RepID=UPI0033B1B818
MNATPNPPQFPEREELSWLLPAAADPVLSSGRHRLLKEHLMNHVQEESRLTVRRWRLATRAAAPLALAAAVAGIAVSIGQTSDNSDAVTVAAGPDRISNVAYTLDKRSDRTVSMSMKYKHNQECADRKCPGSWPATVTLLADPTELQHDLNRMGLNARVYRDDPACPVAQKSLNRDKEAIRNAIGKIVSRGDQLVTAIYPDKIPKDATLVVALPANESDRGLFAVDIVKGDLPSCYHAQAEELP